MGFPVFPVAIRPGGPLGLWLRPWIVSVGEPLSPPRIRAQACAQLTKA